MVFSSAFIGGESLPLFRLAFLSFRASHFRNLSINNLSETGWIESKLELYKLIYSLIRFSSSVLLPLTGNFNEFIFSFNLLNDNEVSKLGSLFFFLILLFCSCTFSGILFVTLVLILKYPTTLLGLFRTDFVSLLLG